MVGARAYRIALTATAVLTVAAIVAALVAQVMAVAGS